VQFDVPPLLSVVGLQLIPASSGSGTVTVPPVPVMGIDVPPAVEPSTFEIPIAVVDAEFVIVTVITAATPFSITASFNPNSRHVIVPVVGLQLIDLPAAVALAPATALMDAMLLVE
jgi:hypothetical protein